MTAAGVIGLSQSHTTFSYTKGTTQIPVFSTVIFVEKASEARIP